MARAVAAALRVRPIGGEWSRLVVDLNRSQGRAGAVPARVDRRLVPGNVLSVAQRQGRLRRYWSPWRQRVERQITRAVAAARPVVHLSIHSFVERLRGVERTNDVGLLYDHRRPGERALAVALRDRLGAAGWSARRNFPYYGHTDGHTSWWRERLSAQRYLGLEIELNQRRVRAAGPRRRLQAALIAALREVIASDPFNR